MNIKPFNRKYLKQHSRLSVFMWILTSIAWEQRTIKVKSGQFTQIVELEKYEVYAPVSRIQKDTSVSRGRCHQLLIEFELAKLIIKREIKMFAPVTSPIIIELVNPWYKNIIDNLINNHNPHEISINQY